MSRDAELKQRWEILVERLSAQFSDHDPLDLDAIICLVGVQELGKYHQKFKKEDKVDLLLWEDSQQQVENIPHP